MISTKEQPKDGDTTSHCDPTTAALEEWLAERDRLRAEVDRLSRTTGIMFEKGYDQAAREIRDFFAKAGQREVVDEIEKILKIRKEGLS
jgi:hypothetical protein